MRRHAAESWSCATARHGTSPHLPLLAGTRIGALLIRQIKIARDTVRKGRTSAVVTLDTIMVNALPGCGRHSPVCRTRRCSVAGLACGPRRRHDCVGRPGFFAGLWAMAALVTAHVNLGGI
jgi:hypothetical protein